MRVWEVSRGDGRHVGLFLGDYFARHLQAQRRLDDVAARSGTSFGDDLADHHQRDEFLEGRDGKPALLSFDDARTLFHEFGHGLHGLLSNVTYPWLSGTGVATDFVELPSQLYEHWLEQPEVLDKFAVHYKTGEPMPHELVDRLWRRATSTRDLARVEYLASALVDLDFHTPRDATKVDAAAFERDALERIDMPAEIVMRHRSPHFGHVFSGGGYAAAYYSYMWSEMLDADGFAAFKETGDIFDPETAHRLHDYVYSAGNCAIRRRPIAVPRRACRRSTRVLAKRGLAEFARAGRLDDHPHRRPPPRRRRGAASCWRRKPAATFSPTAATPSRPWWRWRRRSPPSTRT